MWGEREDEVRCLDAINRLNWLLRQSVECENGETGDSGRGEGAMMWRKSDGKSQALGF